MGNSRYPEPLTPAARREAPLDLNDPVEAQIAKVREIFDRVKLFPEQTTENWADLIALRNTIPDLCTALWYANKKLKELDRGESARGLPDAKP